MKRVYYRIWNPDSFPFNKSVTYYFYNQQELFEDEMKMGFLLEFCEDLDYFNIDEDGFAEVDGFIEVEDEEP